MSKLPTIVFLILLGVILEFSIIPLLGLAGASLSTIAVIVGCIALLGFLEESLVAVLIGGILLDVFSPSPFGRWTLTLVVLWILFFLTSRYRLFAPQLVVVSLAMVGVGTIIALPALWPEMNWLLLVASAFLHALAGTLLFPLIRRFFPKLEVI